MMLMCYHPFKLSHKFHHPDPNNTEKNINNTHAHQDRHSPRSLTPTLQFAMALILRRHMHREHVNCPTNNIIIKNNKCLRLPFAKKCLCCSASKGGILPRAGRKVERDREIGITKRPFHSLLHLPSANLANSSAGVLFFSMVVTVVMIHDR